MISEKIQGYIEDEEYSHDLGGKAPIATQPVIKEM
jgi:hypothetical protein